MPTQNFLELIISESWLCSNNYAARHLRKQTAIFFRNLEKSSLLSVLILKLMICTDVAQFSFYTADNFSSPT